jgi:hypothetical protein
MPPKRTETLEEKAVMLDRKREQGRIRFNRWYEKEVNKAKILEKRAMERELGRLYKAGILPPVPIRHEIQMPQDENEQPYENEVYYDDEPQQDYENEVLHQTAPAPVPEPVVERFTLLDETEVKRIKKIPTTSKMNYDTILAKIALRIANSKKQSDKTLTNYTNLLNLLYRALDTPHDKPLNLNNPEFLFHKFDTLMTVGKIPRPYAFSSKKNWIQLVVLLADPRNDFKLNVKKEAFVKYDNKFKEIKLVETRVAEKKKQDVDLYAGVPYFSKIVERAEATLGKDSAFFFFFFFFFFKIFI